MKFADQMQDLLGRNKRRAEQVGHRDWGGTPAITCECGGLEELRKSVDWYLSVDFRLWGARDATGP